MSTAAPLEAHGRHLMTDVWTSVGVVAGVLLVAVTGWEPLDPIIALLVAVNIVVTGVSLVRRFTGALLDRAHVSVHVLVPGDWTVQRGHRQARPVGANFRLRLVTQRVDR